MLHVFVACAGCIAFASLIKYYATQFREQVNKDVQNLNNEVGKLKTETNDLGDYANQLNRYAEGNVENLTDNFERMRVLVLELRDELGSQYRDVDYLYNIENLSKHKFIRKDRYASEAQSDRGVTFELPSTPQRKQPSNCNVFSEEKKVLRDTHDYQPTNQDGYFSDLICCTEDFLDYELYVVVSDNCEEAVMLLLSVS